MNFDLLAQAFPTTQFYGLSALLAALLDVIFIRILTTRISPDHFQRLLRPLVIVAALFWSCLYSTAAFGFWQACYQYLFPAWVRWAATFYGFLLGGLAFLFWWLALRLPGHPVLGFSVLGGLHSLPGHLTVIYGCQLLVKCPLLYQVSAQAALVFGIFEFVFYWCVIIGVSALLLAGWERWRSSRVKPDLKT